MNGRTKKVGAASFLLGVAAGAGFMIFRNNRLRRHPDSLPDQKRINRALSRALKRAHKRGTIPLGTSHRYVIFSDHHKGGGDRADDFRFCKDTYLDALRHYHQHGFTLVLLGDVEELWEEQIPVVLRTYPEVFELEAEFFPGRYIRLHGNHDNPWENQEHLHQYLHPYFPGLEIAHTLVFQYSRDPETSGEIFLAHGHQGTIDADVFDFIPPVILPYYRQFQNLTGFGQTSPSENECLRGAHDTMMYRWASRQGKLLLIAGHTHRPVWSSKTHLEKLLARRNHLLSLPVEQRPENYAEEIARLKAEIEAREAKSSSCNDGLKTRPCYFNTGCCRFEDGDITGIEIENGEMRLVKWSHSEGDTRRDVLEAAPLAEIFAAL